MEHSVSQEKVGSVIAWAARIMVLVAILAFFLPYASCSVGKEKVGFSSAELAVGKDKEVSVSFLGRSESKAISLEPHPALFLFLALPLLAGGLSFFKKQIARGIAYFLEGIIFLLYNNYVLRTLRSQFSYGEFDLSRYTLNLEIGYKLYQVHGWAMIVLGAAAVAGWYLLWAKHGEPPRPGIRAQEAQKGAQKPFPDKQAPAGSAAHTAPQRESAPPATKPITGNGQGKQTAAPSPVSSKLVFSNNIPGDREKAGSVQQPVPAQERGATNDSPLNPPSGF